MMKAQWSMESLVDHRPVQMAYYPYQSLHDLTGSVRRIRGPKRVVLFCVFAIFLPMVVMFMPLYIRYKVYQDVTYTLGESDLITVDKGISSFWCEGQELQMNATFNAYLLHDIPQISEERQPFQMDKHLELPDDTLEYWGFYLLQGSKVILSVCSRFEGARLMLVKGSKNLKRCALLESSPPTVIDPWEEDHSAPGGEIQVTFQRGEENAAGPQKHHKSTPKPDEEMEYDGGEVLDDDADDSANNIESTSQMTSLRLHRHRQPRSQGPLGSEEDIRRSDHGQNMTSDLMEDTIDADDIRSSGSSFAQKLWKCYGGDTIFTQSFSPSAHCQSADALMKHALRMRTVHEITSTGYYYYIFYSDNDIALNNLFARFTIEKVVYKFPNFTGSCTNSTACYLPLAFLSSEKVLLEVPLQDGVSDEDIATQMVLTSTCRPRMGVYFMFPAIALVLLLTCAFIE